MGRDEESVNLLNFVKCEGNIEGWLKNLEKQMQTTMWEIIKNASSACFNMTLREFIKAFPS
jgi:dynein heavy chain